MSHPDDPDLEPWERVEDLPRILRAMREAVKDAIGQHRRAGNPIAVRRDGRVCWIPASEIPEREPEDPSLDG
jgi:hypothetical protein